MPSKATVRILLRLPAALHQLAKDRAKEQHASLNSVLVHAIEQGLTTGGAEQLEPLIVSRATSQFGAAFIGLLLYGSRARGDAYESSDTDLLLVVDRTVRIERDLYRAWDPVLPEEISLNIAQLPANPCDAGSLWLECALDARILHDPTGQLRRKLDQIKELIVSGAYVRRTTHGQGYWIAT
jgi:hypothetical protein